MQAKQKIKIAFWGTPELTTIYLDALLAADMIPVVVTTNPDRPKGRGNFVTAPPAKLWAMAHNIPVLQPEKLDDDFFAALSAFNLDISIVVAYGKIIPERFITLPAHGTLNVHYSLLPRFRGAAPTESAILAGDTETGATIQIMQSRLDSGPVIATEKTEITPDETTTELRARLSDIGADLLVKKIPEYISGSLTPVPQDETLATHSSKIKKEDGLIDLAGEPLANYRKYRAYIEWPRTYFFINTTRVIITKARYENNELVIERVLPEGKKEMGYEDFKRGLK